MQGFLPMIPTILQTSVDSHRNVFCVRKIWICQDLKAILLWKPVLLPLTQRMLRHSCQRFILTQKGVHGTVTTAINSIYMYIFHYYSMICLIVIGKWHLSFLCLLARNNTQLLQQKTALCSRICSIFTEQLKKLQFFTCLKKSVPTQK